MANFSVLIKFESEEDRETYFADLGPDAQGPPTVGTKVSAVKSLHDLTDNHETRTVTIRRVSLFLCYNFSKIKPSRIHYAN